MAKAPHTVRDDNEPPASHRTTESATRAEAPPLTTAQPGPDEAPVSQPFTGEAPDPAVFEIHEPRKLTAGQVEGLGREALEAYMFGQRTRYDGAGRLWDIRREAATGHWVLMITVTLGPTRLAEAGMPLNRTASTEGEHELLVLVESLAEQAHATHERLFREQQKTIKARGDAPA